MFNGFVKGETDFLFGLLMAAFSGLFLFLLGDLDVGSGARMGPGYFPRLLTYLMLAMSAFLIVKGLVVRGERAAPLALKPLVFVMAALFVFALLIDHLGLLISTMLLVTIAVFGSSERYFLQSVLFGCALAVACSGVFVFALGVPMKVLP